MPKTRRLGPALDLVRVTVTPPPDGPPPVVQYVTPTFAIHDPNGEPLEVHISIPAYGPPIEPLREVKILVLPAGSVITSLAELDAVTPVAVNAVDVTNVSDASFTVNLTGLPADGVFIVQTEFTDGND